LDQGADLFQVAALMDMRQLLDMDLGREGG